MITKDLREFQRISGQLITKNEEARLIAGPLGIYFYSSEFGEIVSHEVRV